MFATALTVEMHYAPGVLMGNWFEEKCFAQDQMLDFRKRIAEKGLVLEKTRALFEHLNTYYRLSPPKDYVSFGSVIQLQANNMNACNSKYRKFRPVLSIVSNERVVGKTDHANEDCELTVAPTDMPKVMNSFRVISGDGKYREDEYLKYGQSFRLQCVDKECDPLVVYCAPQKVNLTPYIHTTFQTLKHGEVNLSVGLVFVKNLGPGKMPFIYANWYASPVDRRDRRRLEGEDVPCNSPVIITHRIACKNLAVTMANAHTLFGQQFLICAQNWDDQFKRPGWQNIWAFYNGKYMIKQRKPCNHEVEISKDNPCDEEDED